MSRTIQTAFAAATFALGLAAAGVAEARDQVFTARLVQPVSERVEIIAQNALWTCEGEDCRAIVNHGLSVRACRQFAREAGQVAAYGGPEAQLNEEELARCNAVAPAVREANNRAGR